MVRDKIKDLIGYERDKHSRGIVSTDANALKGYRIQRDHMIKFAKVGNLENDVAMLKNDINDIKSMLVQLINNK
jgi:hypothetical protein